MTAILSPPDGSASVESLFDRLGREDAAWLREWVRPGYLVLDVGCGMGRVERHLAAYCARIDGVDVSDEMLARAREWTTGRDNVAFHRSSATDLGMFPDGTFDFAFSFLVLQHLDYDDAFLALCEIRRVLKRGATALIQFPDFASQMYANTFLRQATGRERRPARVRVYTRDFVTRSAELAGFVVDRIEANPGGTMNENEIVAVLQRAG